MMTLCLLPSVLRKSFSSHACLSLKLIKSACAICCVRHPIAVHSACASDLHFCPFSINTSKSKPMQRNHEKKRLHVAPPSTKSLWRCDGPDMRKSTKAKRKRKKKKKKDARYTPMIRSLRVKSLSLVVDPMFVARLSIWVVCP